MRTPDPDVSCDRQLTGALHPNLPGAAARGRSAGLACGGPERTAAAGEGEGEKQGGGGAVSAAQRSDR